MLVLSRKEGEKILIGSALDGTEIEISVVEIRGGRVRLGISAPRNVSIRRQELDFQGAAVGVANAAFSTPVPPTTDLSLAEVHLASGSC
ncbi:MAG: carbon storage regulator [Planctomycetaceae bacterium]|jgi:carbon storage regulator